MYNHSLGGIFTEDLKKLLVLLIDNDDDVLAWELKKVKNKNYF